MSKAPAIYCRGRADEVRDRTHDFGRTGCFHKFSALFSRADVACQHNTEERFPIGFSVLNSTVLKHECLLVFFREIR